MFSKYRVKNLCFSCGNDITLHRFLIGLPCHRCEESDELIHLALKPPQPFERLVSRYRAITGSEAMKVWKPWALAILNSEAITIPDLDIYKPLEFSLWMTGAYRGPAVIGIREDQMDTVLKSPLLKDRTLILQGKPSEDYIRILTDPEEISTWDFKNFNPLIVWHLEKQPILRDAIRWGAIVINILDDYPSAFLPAFDLSKTRNETSTPLPMKRIRLNQLPDNPDTLKELIYMLIPYLPEDFRTQFIALSGKEDLSDVLLQKLRDMLKENLLSSTVSTRLKNAGILHEDTITIPNIRSVLKVLKENTSPQNRKFTKFNVSRELIVVLDRGLHLFNHTWRTQQELHELRDISTLLILPEGGPPIRDLGFDNKITRKAAGFVVHEAIGTIGPVTIIRLPNIFHIRGTTVNYDTNMMHRLQRLIKRYTRITVIADTEFLVQGILLASLAKPFSKTRLFRANDLYSGKFTHLQDEDSHRYLASILQNFKEGTVVQSSIKHRLEIHLPDPRLYKVLRMIKKTSTQPASRTVRLRLNGIDLQFEVPMEIDIPPLRPEDVIVNMEIKESAINPPIPITFDTLIDATVDLPVKERLIALKKLYEKGFITYPYEDTPANGFFAEILKRYVEYTFGEEFVYNSEERAGILPTRPISHTDLQTLANIFMVQQPEIYLYKVIFQRAVASFMKPVKVKTALISIQFKGISKTHSAPINILEPGFNLVLPIGLVRLSPVERLTVTRVELRDPDKPHLLTLGTLIKLLHQEIPDIDPLKSLWMLRPYLNITKAGITIKGEYYQRVD